MARAPETGFYFEPLTERLALVVEGAPFPSDDHWAWLGDPIEMTQDEARVSCALRWPGVDPETLEVEFDLDFERAAAEAELQRVEAMTGFQRLPREYDLSVDALLAQADLLREAARQVALEQTSPETLEKAVEEAELIRDLARGLALPSAPGRVIEVAEGLTPEQRARRDQAEGPEATQRLPGPPRGDQKSPEEGPQESPQKSPDDASH